MAALDTNVLIRFLVQDDAAQCAAALALIRGAVEDEQTLFVPITVTLEMEWVLRSRYRFDKPAVLQAVALLLSTAELSFESETALEVALAHYKDSAADFADCLHTALAVQAGEAPLWTFDRAAGQLQGARELKA